MLGWHREKPEEDISEDAASVAVEGQDWRGHAGKLRHSTMKRTYEKLFVKVQSRCSRRQQCFGDANTMRWPPRTAAAAVEYRQLENRTQGVCYKKQSWRSDPSPCKSLEDHERIPDIGLLDFNFGCVCDCALIFFPLEVRRYFSGAQLIWIFKRLWILKDIGHFKGIEILICKDCETFKDI